MFYATVLAIHGRNILIKHWAKDSTKKIKYLEQLTRKFVLYPWERILVHRIMHRGQYRGKQLYQALLKCAPITAEANLLHLSIYLHVF